MKAVITVRPHLWFSELNGKIVDIHPFPTDLYDKEDVGPMFLVMEYGIDNASSPRITA